MSQLPRHMRSACCKYSVHRALSPHCCPCWAGVTPAPCPAQRQTGSVLTGNVQPSSEHGWFHLTGPWGGEGLGARLNKPIAMYCFTAHAALAPDSKGENGQRNCCCALRENNLLNFWSVLTTWVKYLSLVTPVPSLVPPRHFSCSGSVYVFAPCLYRVAFSKKL